MRLHRSPVLFLCLLVSLHACSGGGSRSATPAGPLLDAHVVSDTAGGAPGRLYGRVAAFALEDDQGQLTANLVAGSQPEFVINDPLGASFGLPLADFGPGTFRKVHIGFLVGSVLYKQGTGAPVPVTVVGGGIVASFATPLQVSSRGAYRIQLRHRSPVRVEKDATGKLAWQPDMVAESAAPVLLQDAEIEIVATDLNQGTAAGVIRSMTDLRTTVGFLRDAVLVIDGEERTVAGFLGGLRAKDRIRVFGWLDRASNTRAAFAERVDPLDRTPGKGRKNKVRGTITAATASSVDVRLFEIRIGGRDLPRNQPVTLTVDSSQAKIKYVPRYGRHRGHLDPTSLATDMYVEVEWHGDAPNQQVVAHKINIRSDGRFGFVHKLAGTVRAVDTVAGTLTLAGDFRFGKEHYQELTIAIGSDTLLVEDRQGGARELRLDQVVRDDAVWLLGRKQTGAKVDALLVVVER